MTILLKLSWLLFACLLALIIVVLSPLRTTLDASGDLRSFVPLLGILGALLVVLAAPAGAGRWLKFFFILTGASALGWPLSLWLHGILIRAFPTEPVTYVLVFYILPLTFVTGISGTIISGIMQAIEKWKK